MLSKTEDNLLLAILDSWDRNNRILINLLGALPQEALHARVSPTSPSVGEMFAHLVYVRLVFVFEDAPDQTIELPEHEWLAETDPGRIAAKLDSSARTVRDALEDRLRTGRPMQVHYDHPVLFLQHMIWHEGYHHGQIKLALKVAGHPLDDEQIGPCTWDLWMRKSSEADRG